MALASCRTRCQWGITSPLVTVEVHLAGGLPGTHIVGLAETTVKESRDRVKSAIVNSGFQYPRQAVVVNLAPADLPKSGGRYDLAIALAILTASGQLPGNCLAGMEYLGELALDGKLRGVEAALPAVVQAGKAGHLVILPQQNSTEAALGKQQAFSATSLLQVCEHLLGQAELPRIQPPETSLPPADPIIEIHGQHQAKRALEIAAAGGHNLLLSGPPGTGKTLLARHLATLLPRLSEQEALEVATIRSISGQVPGVADWLTRPFRQPHHTATAAALAGGGSVPRPGEVTLAHHGVLFLDELPEYDRRCLEVLREPLESGEVTISRARARFCFPARFQLVAAMNPCPCGFFGHGTIPCSCGEERVQRYRSRISGPLLDRIDIQVRVPALPRGQLTRPAPAEQSIQARLKQRQKIRLARQRMQHRFCKPNAALSSTEIRACCRLDRATRLILDEAVERLLLSARGFYRVLRVARTIADLADAEEISSTHVAEAIGYRTGFSDNAQLSA